MGKKTSLIVLLTPFSLKFKDSALTNGELIKYNLIASAPYYSTIFIGSG